MGLLSTTGGPEKVENGTESGEQRATEIQDRLPESKGWTLFCLRPETVLHYELGKKAADSCGTEISWPQ